MNENETNSNLEKLLSLSTEELNSIFSKLTVFEIDQLLNKLKELDEND